MKDIKENVDMVEKSPIIPIAIMPFRISCGRGSRDVSAYPDVIDATSDMLLDCTAKISSIASKIKAEEGSFLSIQANVDGVTECLTPEMNVD